MPTAIREFATEVGNSVALTVIIFDWLGRGKEKTQLSNRTGKQVSGTVLEDTIVFKHFNMQHSLCACAHACAFERYYTGCCN